MIRNIRKITRWGSHLDYIRFTHITSPKDRPAGLPEGACTVIQRLPEDDSVFRLTPALEQAGYRVPPAIAKREGLIT